MGRSATTTAAVRRAIQHSQESLRALANRYGLKKTVAKWKKRTSAADLPTGPKEPKSTVLSIEEEAVIVAFKRHTLLPLVTAFTRFSRPPDPRRSSLTAVCSGHGISGGCRISRANKEPRKRFKSYPIGFFHIDLAEVQTAEVIYPVRRH